MPKGAFDPAWPLIDSQQPSQCYPQFNLGRQNQGSASTAAFPSSHLKSQHNFSNTNNNSGTLNRNRPGAQLRHRPWSPPAVDHFGRHISMVIQYLEINN